MKALLLASVFFATVAYAKPVEVTPLPRAIKEAPIVVVAETVQRQYDALTEGETSAEQAFDENAFWVEYKVVAVLRSSPAAAVRPSEILRIQNQNNNCLPVPGKYTRQSGDVYFVSDGGARSAVNDNHHPKGAKSILFLSLQKSHFGWYVSPTPWSETLEKKILATPMTKPSRR